MLRLPPPSDHAGVHCQKPEQGSPEMQPPQERRGHKAGDGAERKQATDCPADPGESEGDPFPEGLQSVRSQIPLEHLVLRIQTCPSTTIPICPSHGFCLTRPPPSHVPIMPPLSCIFLDYPGELWQPSEVSFNGSELTTNGVLSRSHLGPCGLSWPEKGSLLPGPGPALEPLRKERKPMTATAGTAARLQHGTVHRARAAWPVSGRDPEGHNTMSYHVRRGRFRSNCQ